MSHLQFSRATFLREFSRATKLQVWHGESSEFLTVAQLYFRIELWSILCNSVDRMPNADWCNFIAQLCCTLSRQNCARKLQVWHRSNRDLHQKKLVLSPSETWLHVKPHPTTHLTYFSCSVHINPLKGRNVNCQLVTLGHPGLTYHF